MKSARLIEPERNFAQISRCVCVCVCVCVCKNIFVVAGARYVWVSGRPFWVTVKSFFFLLPFLHK